MATRDKKVFRDITSRKGRSALVILSILIGVFGVTVMVSATDIINRQLKQDMQPKQISQTHVYVTTTNDTPVSNDENLALLNQLRTLDNVIDVEGQAVYSTNWKLDDTTEFEDGFVVAFSDGFENSNLEPIARLVKGRYPNTGQGEIAIEQRLADVYQINLGDSLQFLQIGNQTSQSWTVVGTVIHPYFTIAPAIGDQIQPNMAIFANYEDAQTIVGFKGLSAIHVRYTSVKASKNGLAPLMEHIAQDTPYTPLFTFLDEPEDNFIMSIINQVNLTLNVLGVLAMLVSGFLVTNVMNTIIIEQKRQIGVMKSMGASLWDNFYIYLGIALLYGVIGTIPAVLLAIPVAGIMAQEIGLAAFTYIDGIKVSLLGIGIGTAMGLLVPMLATLVPVFNSMRISILDAMTDLGISSNWGTSRASRWIGNLPFPNTVVQAISNLYQKKGRLALTGLALMLAVASFMGVSAVSNALGVFMDRMYNAFDYEIVIIPQEAISVESMQNLIIQELSGVQSVNAGYTISVGVDGFVSTNPFTEGTNQVSAMGIDTYTMPVTFDLQEGKGWSDDPTREGIVISRSIAETLNKQVGDDLSLTLNGNEFSYPIIGVDNFAFDAIYMNWQTLATIAGHVNADGQPLAGVFYVNLQGQPSIESVDQNIDQLTGMLAAQGIQATYTNQPRTADNQAQQVGAFDMVFNATSFIMALVGGIGLMVALSMAVFERQKEIGVMRSIGASSLTIIGQFLLEGVMVGLLAWLVAVPTSVILGLGLMNILPFDYLSFNYPLEVLGLGLIGVLVLASFASLWPSFMASRKTVSEILRYS